MASLPTRLKPAGTAAFVGVPVDVAVGVPAGVPGEVPAGVSVAGAPTMPTDAMFPQAVASARHSALAVMMWCLLRTGLPLFSTAPEAPYAM
ncbi:hypothetical protein GCM10017600_27500 [Streptosporangium carneum]|uniref:Uncharacterized protein n=1 Tax=Streptosporangium carneum TaxID=47481 RepID=A0A9W6I149_9ACTN|nr:hypothetical protein GCM10017600_27500 [Streptosporangium carneum]